MGLGYAAARLLGTMGVGPLGIVIWVGVFFVAVYLGALLLVAGDVAGRVRQLSVETFRRVRGTAS